MRGREVGARPTKGQEVSNDDKPDRNSSNNNNNGVSEMGINALNKEVMM